jgi:protein-S-isoprenylcysteine O-methyltransferase Ste14
MEAVKLLSGALFVMGLALFVSARRVLHGAQQRGLLAVKGPYSYVRHPQYVALGAAGLGLLLAWPTPLTLLLFAAVAWQAVRLAGREDRRMAAEYGCCWRAYAYGRPAFVPRLSRIQLALADLGRLVARRNGTRSSTVGARALITHGRTRS